VPRWDKQSVAPSEDPCLRSERRSATRSRRRCPQVGKAVGDTVEKTAPQVGQAVGSTVEKTRAQVGQAVGSHRRKDRAGGRRHRRDGRAPGREGGRRHRREGRAPGRESGRRRLREGQAALSSTAEKVARPRSGRRSATVENAVQEGGAGMASSLKEAAEDIEKATARGDDDRSKHDRRARRACCVRSKGRTQVRGQSPACSPRPARMGHPRPTASESRTSRDSPHSVAERHGGEMKDSRGRRGRRDHGFCAGSRASRREEALHSDHDEGSGHVTTRRVGLPPTGAEPGVTYPEVEASVEIASSPPEEEATKA